MIIADVSIESTSATSYIMIAMLSAIFTYIIICYLTSFTSKLKSATTFNHIYFLLTYQYVDIDISKYQPCEFVDSVYLLSVS